MEDSKAGKIPGSKSGKSTMSASGTNMKDFRLEYAKSGAAKCGVCEEKIKKVCGRFWSSASQLLALVLTVAILLHKGQNLRSLNTRSLFMY